MVYHHRILQRWLASSTVLLKPPTTEQHLGPCKSQHAFEYFHKSVNECIHALIVDISPEVVQAPAQAQNIRDSLDEAGVKDTKVSIALRNGSPSWGEAQSCGFSEDDGTLGEVFDMIAQSDFVILLISDAAQVSYFTIHCHFATWLVLCLEASALLEHILLFNAWRWCHGPCDIGEVMQAKLYPRLLAAMQPGAVLGLSHGFLLGVMQSDGADFRDDIDVVLMAPKVPAKP